jgi:hypothetical protein
MSLNGSLTNWLRAMSGIRRCNCGRLFRLQEDEKAEALRDGLFARSICAKCKESTQEDLIRERADLAAEYAIQRLVESDENVPMREIANDINHIIFEYSQFKHWRDAVIRALGPIPEGMGTIEYIKALKAHSAVTRALTVKKVKDE